MTYLLSILLLLTTLLYGFFLSIRFLSSIISNYYGAPYVPLPQDVVSTMINMITLKKNDVIIDLGSGDARLLIEACNKWPVQKAIGYEISWYPYWLSLINIYKQKKQNITIYRKDMFSADLKNITVVFLYQHPKILPKLTTKLLTQLPSTAAIISARFTLEGCKPDTINKDSQYPIYLYWKKNQNHLKTQK